MSPENINKWEYSTKSDVWSYSVLLVELFGTGALPYPDIVNSITVATKVANGELRPTVPDK